MINVNNQIISRPDSVSTALTSRDHHRTDWYNNGGKRFFDITISLIALSIILPALAILGLIIFAQDKGKPFFIHSRVGQEGKSFGCIKMRSMVMNAEERLKDILADSPEKQQEWSQTQKLNDDPRITRLGNILRKTSLDELPQLFNVLRGEMSLVGPRPIVRDELPRYGKDADTYLKLRPGLTGLWQTTGRNDVSYQERVDMDVAYSRNMSFVEDLRIMVMTIVTMLKRTGR
ncbi:sugar transferase [Paracoccus aerodenitrificans]|uniref:sugar transferase n=1 Tax=Paracoccus aerodenitrificans TaxID=3017781 RepID=UPI0022F12A44|nr:sugar transferase [Paracoccus aerodenitrificans]WBU63486.1 sugar transferase [Paracoccus aerodenitrificans]